MLLEEMNTATGVQILDAAVYILHSANTLWKGMNQTTLLPAINRIVSQTRIFNLSMATGLREGN